MPVVTGSSRVRPADLQPEHSYLVTDLDMISTGNSAMTNCIASVWRHLHMEYWPAEGRGLLLGAEAAAYLRLSVGLNGMRQLASDFEEQTGIVRTDALLELADQALVALDSRGDESVEEWAQRLASDLMRSTD